MVRDAYFIVFNEAEYEIVRITQIKQGVVEDCGMLLAPLAGNCPPLMFCLFFAH